MSGGAKLNVRVADAVKVNDLITRFRFVTRDGAHFRHFPAARIPWWKWMTMAPGA